MNKWLVTSGTIIVWIVASYTYQLWFAETPDWHLAFGNAYQGVCAVLLHAVQMHLYAKKD